VNILLLLALTLFGAQEGVLEKTSLSFEGNSIALRPYNVDGEGYFATLVVLKPDGSVLFESKQVIEPDDPMAFGSWPIGVSLPEIVGDIDKDKVIELVTPAPQSDVRPVQFKVLRWLEGGFRPAFTRALLLGKDGHVRWTTPKEGNQTWVSHFDGWQGDQLKATLMTNSGKTGTALLSSERGGFVLVRWTSPLKS
jgi:hypothetical protein